jgi:hypothetical protein
LKSGGNTGNARIRRAISATSHSPRGQRRLQAKPYPTQRPGRHHSRIDHSTPGPVRKGNRHQAKSGKIDPRKQKGLRNAVDLVHPM